MAPTGDYVFKSVPGLSYNDVVWLSTSATSSGWGSAITSGGPLYQTYTGSWPTTSNPCLEVEKTSLSEQELNAAIASVTEELSNINLKYRIFDADYALCEVLAAKMLHARLPKKCVEFAVSDKLPNTPGTCSTWKAGRRNTFLIVKLEGRLNPNTFTADAVEHVVDVCAKQHGGPQLQVLNDQTSIPWKPAYRYKTSSSLVKRLLKDGHQLKEVHLKDAIALSTRYVITDQPTEIDTHQINPSDDAGKKFLERFGKEVGFKTTLAQLLLDVDPVIAAKAKEIAQILLLR